MRGIVVGIMAGLLTVGCGDSGPPVVPVSGKVTLDGKPLSGASVTFVPAGEAAGTFGGSATTDGEGAYTLLNTKGAKGVSPGDYRVTVSKAELKNPALAESGGISESDLKQVVPLPYTKADATPLKFSVDASGKAIDIPIVSKK